MNTKNINVRKKWKLGITENLEKHVFFVIFIDFSASEGPWGLKTWKFNEKKLQEAKKYD